MENLFITAIRNKFRFEYRGIISVEDLWDLKVEALDDIYRNLSSQIKKANEESLLKSKTKEQEVIELKMQIVKYIVEEKLKEAENRRQAKARKEQKQKIMEILNEKEDQDLKNKSAEELKAMLEDLD